MSRSIETRLRRLEGGAAAEEVVALTDTDPPVEIPASQVRQFYQEIEGATRGRLPSEIYRNRETEFE